jgi:D-amino-acid oxidase
MSAPPAVHVVGAGVIGLTTALELLRRGARVAVWTRDTLDNTTSAVAAAVWYPFIAEPRARVLDWSRTTYEALAREANDDPSSGVRMERFVEVFDVPDPDVWWASAVPTLRFLPQRDVPEGFRAALEVFVPVADTRHYLPRLLERVRALGGEVHVRNVDSLNELARVDEDPGHAPRAVVNCTGLGARELCGDMSLVPIRGQVLIARGLALLHGVLDESGPSPIYAIPRGDEVILGGTAQFGDSRRAPDHLDSESILAGLQRHLPDLAPRHVVTARVGLRPWRPAIRLEREPGTAGPLLVHNYGHGGSGYTVAWGCAREAAELALGSNS